MPLVDCDRFGADREGGTLGTNKDVAIKSSNVFNTKPRLVRTDYVLNHENRVQGSMRFVEQSTCSRNISNGIAISAIYASEIIASKIALGVLPILGYRLTPWNIMMYCGSSRVLMRPSVPSAV